MDSRTSEKTAASKPVYIDDEFAVFLDTKTIKQGPHAGKSFEYFTCVEGKGPGAWRIEVPARVGGYDLQNRNTRDGKFSDVVSLVNGNELVRDVPNTGNNGSHTIIIAGIGVRETPRADASKQPYRTLTTVAAFAEFARDAAPDELPRAFIIPSRLADGKESTLRDLKCYTSIAGVPIYVRDAYAFRDAAAAGRKHVIERDGVEISLANFEKTKSKQTVMRLKASPLQQDRPISATGGTRGRAAVR
jgi:hypothetical protein